MTKWQMEVFNRKTIIHICSLCPFTFFKHNLFCAFHWWNEHKFNGVITASAIWRINICQCYYSILAGHTQPSCMQHLDWKLLVLCVPLCGICWQILIFELQHNYSIFVLVYQDKQSLMYNQTENFKLFCCLSQYPITKMFTSSYSSLI